MYQSKLKKRLTYKKKQSGGDRTAESIEAFVHLIQLEDQLDIEKTDNLTSINYNHYYQLMIKRLPCSLRFRDFTYELGGSQRYLTKIFKFNKSLALLSTHSMSNYNEGSAWGVKDIIQCIKERDGGYTIIMGDYNALFHSNKIIPCDTQVQMISLRSYDQKKSGHAVILLLNNTNHDNKTFTIINPGGEGGGKVDDDLDDTKCYHMLKQILTDYTYESFNFPACQVHTRHFTGSCLLWSQLYIDLILRFGLYTAKNYLDSMILRDVRTDEIVLKYSNYITRFLTDNTYFIDDPWYITSGKIRSLIYEITRKLSESEVVKAKLNSKKLAMTVFQMKGIFIYFNPEVDYDWVIDVIIDSQKYRFNNKNYDQQTMSTILKKHGMSLNDKLLETIQSLDRSDSIIANILYFPRTYYQS